jgi:hypothetical protein
LKQQRHPSFWPRHPQDLSSAEAGQGTAAPCPCTPILACSHRRFADGVQLRPGSVFGFLPEWLFSSAGIPTEPPRLTLAMSPLCHVTQTQDKTR